MKVVYSDGYFLELGDHVFPAVKYRRVRDRLLEEKILSPSDLVTPAPATDEDVLLVHTPSYVNKLKTGSFSPIEAMRLDVPVLASSAARPSAWRGWSPTSSTWCAWSPGG